MNLRTPITIVTGFLGAGKTAVLSNLMKQVQSQRFAVVNEPDDLFVPLEAFINDALKNKGDLDRIIIETSGLAVPTTIVQRLQTPALHSHFVLDAIILIIDTPLFLEGKFTSTDAEESVQQIFLWQLECADLVVLNKIDYLPENKLLEAQQQIRTLCPTAQFIELAYDAMFEESIALGLPHNEIVSLNETKIDTKNNSGWNSIALRTTDWQEADHLKKAIQVIAETEPVLRIKGTTRVEETGEQLLFQGVRQRIEVFIGEPLPQKQLVAHKDEHHLHQNSHEQEHHSSHPHHHAAPEPRPHHIPPAEHHHHGESHTEEIDRRLENVMEEHGVQTGWLDRSIKGEIVFTGFQLNRDAVLKKLRTYTHTTWY